MGEQKATNYALRAPDKATFIGLVTEGQPPAPGLFRVRRDPQPLRPRPARRDASLPPAMSVRGGARGDRRRRDADRRPRTPRSSPRATSATAINVGLSGRYAEFAGSVVPSDVDIVLVTEPGQELEGKNRLARIGFDRVIGYLDQPYKVMFQHRDDAQVASRLTAHGVRRAGRDDRRPPDRRRPQPRRGGRRRDPRRRRIPVGQLPEPDRTSSTPTPPDGRVLRRRLPLVGGREPAAPARFRRRQRPHRRVRRLDRRSSRVPDAPLGTDTGCAGAMTRLGFALLSDSCIGCHACTVACKSEHDVPLGVNRTWVKYIETGTFPNTGRSFSVMRCNQCDDAPCMTICPTRALYRAPNGVVDFDDDDCIGCKACMNACPYDALVHQSGDEHRPQVQLLQPPRRGRARTGVRGGVPDARDRHRRSRRPRLRECRRSSPATRSRCEHPSRAPTRRSSTAASIRPRSTRRAR